MYLSELWSRVNNRGRCWQSLKYNWDCHNFDEFQQQLIFQGDTNMSLERWEPLREMVSLRDAVQNLLAESLTRNNGEVESTLMPAVDVAESPEAFDLHVSLPGIKPEDVSITVHGNTVTIAGESKLDETKTEGNWVLRERRQGKYSRTMSLGCALDPDKAVAKTENGVLALHLPKAEKERPKQIKVG